MREEKLFVIKKFKFLLIAACIALSGVCSSLFFSANNDKLQKNTTITVKQDTTRTLEAEITGIYPGNSREYVINLNVKDAEILDISLAFRNKENNDGKLKNYIDVTISAGDVKIEKTLKELLDDDAKYDLGDNVKTITITYTMPESVGNESKGATADFYIDISAKASEEK